MKKILVVTLLFLMKKSVFALTVTTPRIELTLNRGDSTSGELIVKNEESSNTADKTFYISVEKLNNLKSGISFTQGDYSRIVKVPEKITIRNGETVKIPFLVTLPDDAIQNYNFTIFLITEEYYKTGIGAKVGSFLRVHVPNGYTESPSDIQSKKEKKEFKKIATESPVASSTNKQFIATSKQSIKEKFNLLFLSLKNIWNNN